MEKVKLTQFSHGAGCGCKIASSVLDEILKNSGAGFFSKSLLVGNDTKDDAAVYDIGNGTALISTVDFFMPVVDDAFDFGRIAATNAISDVYAMGGKPFMAVAVLGWPVNKIPVAIAQEVIKGAKAICKEAEVVLAGGHTIDSPEPFFGLSVNGTVPIPHLKKNCTAKKGDLLFLTKPIGTGMLNTALKRGLKTEADLKQAVDSMCRLNKFGGELGKCDFVHAMTDVTGFALLGHLVEMCEGANLSAQIEYSKVPLMEGIKELAVKSISPGSTQRNWKSCETKVVGIHDESLLTLCDPQTSGGLLVAVDRKWEQEFLKLAEESHETVYHVGEITVRKEKYIYITQ